MTNHLGSKTCHININIVQYIYSGYKYIKVFPAAPAHRLVVAVILQIDVTFLFMHRLKCNKRLMLIKPNSNALVKTTFKLVKPFLRLVCTNVLTKIQNSLFCIFSVYKALYNSFSYTYIFLIFIFIVSQYMKPTRWQILMVSDNLRSWTPKT